MSPAVHAAEKTTALRASLLFCLALALVAAPGVRADTAPLPLWNGPAPMSKGTADQDTPKLLPFLPANRDTCYRGAVVICPGGGYQRLEMQTEGINEAVYLQTHGFPAFVLQYRTAAGGYHHPVPLLDAQRAIRLLRHNAGQYGLDSGRIGVMGFSAGGHLAATLETHFDLGNPQATDPVDRESCRPDFAVLCYPVITMKANETHQETKDALLGQNPDPALVQSLSIETQVTAQTPPTIIFTAADDDMVSVQNSRDMFAALQKANVSSAYHEYPAGGHGFGYGKVPDTSPPGWMDTLFAWMKGQGIAEPRYIRIYAGPAPFATDPGESPNVLEFLPPKGGAPTPAILVFPGGGYQSLALQNEGKNEADWLQAHGIAAFAVVYRLPRGRSQVPLSDTQRAVRWVRSQAAQFNIDPNKIGALGLSAGGHLVSTLETHFDAGNPQAPDPIDRVSCRPDFVGLVYPVITMKEGETNAVTKANLLGPNPDPAKVDYFSNELHVTSQTPPTIIMYSKDDPIVPIQNSQDMYAALQKAGVPSEIHEFPTGGHGYGFGSDPDLSPKGWFDVTFYGWLKKMGFAGNTAP